MNYSDKSVKILKKWYKYFYQDWHKNINILVKQYYINKDFFKIVLTIIYSFYLIKFFL